MTNIAAPADHNLNNQRTSGNQYHRGVSLVLDTEFQSRYPGNAQSTAVAILNIVDGFYSAQPNIKVWLYDLESLTDNGSLVATDSGDLLTAFRLWLNNSPLPFSGLAHLLSGKDFDGSNVGMAWLGSVCDSGYGSGVNQVTFSAAACAAILAHEMGHNFNMQHDGISGLNGNSCLTSGFIMNAITILNNAPIQFSTCSLTYLNNYLTSNSLACLAPPPFRVFSHGFE